MYVTVLYIKLRDMNTSIHYFRFHGLISREEADHLVSVQSGCYLVRESQNSPGQYALSMRYNLYLTMYTLQDIIISHLTFTENVLAQVGLLIEVQF